MLLLNEDAEKGWNSLVTDVHSYLNRKNPKTPPVNPPVLPSIPKTTTEKSRKKWLLEIFLVSIITAIGLSIGYWIFNFALRLM